MSESKKSRREFLGIAGATVAGVVIASTALELPAVASKAPAAAAQSDSLESWLLNTGQGKIDPQLFMNVRQQVG